MFGCFQNPCLGHVNKLQKLQVVKAWQVNEKLNMFLSCTVCMCILSMKHRQFCKFKICKSKISNIPSLISNFCSQEILTPELCGKVVRSNPLWRSSMRAKTLEASAWGTSTQVDFEKGMEEQRPALWQFNQPSPLSHVPHTTFKKCKGLDGFNKAFLKINHG